MFYICAAEPEYTVIGEQVIETESKDAAIYRYDSATGKRTMLVPTPTFTRKAWERYFAL